MNGYILAYRARDGRMVRAWDPDNDGALFAVGSLERAAKYAAEANALPKQKCRHLVCHVVAYDAGTDTVHDLQPVMPPAADMYHNPDPTYLRGLIDRAGVSQREAARRLGVSPRMMRQYLAGAEAVTATPAPYLVQFGLEALAAAVDVAGG